MELNNIKKQTENPDFWLDTKNASKVNKRQRVLEDRLETISSLTASLKDIDFLFELYELEPNTEIENNIVSSLDNVESEMEETFIKSLLSGKYDDNNAILTLHAGAGGTEAQDWCEMLFRMYTRFCEKQNYKVTTLDFQEGDVAGIKSVSFLVEGEKAYGYLKAEKGVHRLVRISPFDSSARRHTSFASLDVIPEINDDVDVEIRPEDLKIDTYRSSGAGGQHVNKTESAIRITHLPTGIVVACQNERSQVQNKEVAMNMLRSKLIALKEEEMQNNISEIKGDLKKIEWGSQIRSYVFCPYTLVKDHRTGYEEPSVEKVMDGDIKPFILDYLKKSN